MKILIIGDVHARSFWREPCLDHAEEYDKIVFLGDFTDPYTDFEDTRQEDVIPTIKDVIEFKKANKRKVVLLIGNHDMSYFADNMYKCRFDYKRAPEIRKLFLDNIKLFQLAYERKIGRKRYVFTHSGIIMEWLNMVKKMMKWDNMTEDNSVKYLNNHFKSDKDHGSNILNFVSRNRGGWDRYGSCIWGDLEEFYWYSQSQNRPQMKAYQVFGHTSIVRPVFFKTFACLDAKQCIVLEGNKFKDLDGNILKVEK